LRTHSIPESARRIALPLGLAALSTTGLFVAAGPADAAGHGVTWNRSCAVVATAGQAVCPRPLVCDPDAVGCAPPTRGV
jgi:hypothetical protein